MYTVHSKHNYFAWPIFSHSINIQYMYGEQKLPSGKLNEEAALLPSGAEFGMHKNKPTIMIIIVIHVQCSSVCH